MGRKTNNKIIIKSRIQFHRPLYQIMKLVITTLALFGAYSNAFTLDKESASSALRSKRSDGSQNIVDLATIDSDTGAGKTFWANLERECVEEQCGLEEAIETYEEFGAQAKIQVISSSQQSYDKYVNEYVSNYLKKNNLRDTVLAKFDTCIKSIDKKQSVEGFISKLFNIWMY